MADDTNANESRNEPVTISAPAVGAVTVDPQNPLPEASFMWRRVFAAVICANALVFTWFMAAWLAEGKEWDHVYGLTKLMIYGAGVVLTYYFIAPSAAELTNMIQSASIIKKSLGLAGDAAKQAAGAPETALPARFGASGTADSRIPAAPVGGPEIDAAPRGRT